MVSQRGACPGWRQDNLTHAVTRVVSRSPAVHMVWDHLIPRANGHAAPRTRKIQRAPASSALMLALPSPHAHTLRRAHSLLTASHRSPCSRATSAHRQSVLLRDTVPLSSCADGFHFFATTRSSVGASSGHHRSKQCRAGGVMLMRTAVDGGR